MSEFTECYYLYSSNQNDGVKLLKKAWLRGYVYPAGQHWVTILPSGRPFRPNKRLIGQNKGVLLHLLHAEDHGWQLSVYEGRKRTFHYTCEWEEELSIDQEEYDRHKMVELINRNPYKIKSVTPLDITKIFYVTDYEDIIERNPVHQIAELLRLEHYEWLSYDYMQRDCKENPEELTGQGIRYVQPLFSF
ncbi:hypothetical protein [Paenibacillus soyae]|uniref:Uncharacterized protein n=1 Tax=Paenibacillus soyae TaxID=2969249 RepID=A0A9X2MQD3_9BACL|nr:hypothetical protein [Paenibacillus soyae]MCR2803881.1 hypothetical protein [Paenibacillus soyae]